METVFVGHGETEEVSESSAVMPEGGAELRQLELAETANSTGSELGAQLRSQHCSRGSLSS